MDKGKREGKKGKIMMKKVMSVFLALLLALSYSTPGFAAATQVDSLIEKLVDKGILSKEEAREIKTEIINDEKSFREEGLKQSLDGWVRNMKIKGDLRTRFQYEKRENTSSRNRARIRFRLGVETKVNDKVKLAAGLATGSGDPRSTNQTVDNNFEKPQVRLDYAYAQYAPAEWGTFTAGIIPKPYWNPKDLIFDSDIYFNGIGANLSHKLTDRIKLLANGGLHFMEETSSNEEPMMFGFQLGGDMKLTEKIKAKLLGQYYVFQNVEHMTAFAQHRPSVAYNTLSSGRYVNDYDAWGGGGELKISNPLGIDEVPMLKFFGEYIYNPQPQDIGYLFGAAIGDDKVSGPNQWQIAYNYRFLEDDAILDIFPDSDFYSGATNSKGHEISVSYGLAKNVWLELDYYRSQNISRSELTEDLFQTDVNFKF